MSRSSSEGVTPPSSLIRTHASDQIPPYRFRFPYTEGLCRLSSDPCWKMALPDVISAVCVRALGPIPRRVPDDLVRLDALACRLDASIAGHRPHLSLEKFGTRKTPCNATSTGGVFRGCSHSLMFKLPHSLGSPVAPTAVTGTGLPSRLHHAMNMWLPALKHSRFYMNCDIATYPKRTN